MPPLPLSYCRRLSSFRAYVFFFLQYFSVRFCVEHCHGGCFHDVQIMVHSSFLRCLLCTGAVPVFAR
uniref:Secreted protein n=1 Tax=Mesocestoides corti TaxID=53468 RepID=A0A5K3G5N2_MESCO